MSLLKDPSYLTYLAQLEKQKGLPSGLLINQMKAESAGNPQAVSPVGAKGPFQFMDATAKQYGIDPFDPMQAAQAAAQMNSELLNKYNGDVPSALAAYNWGQGNVDRKGLENAPAETRDYIQKIVSALNPISTARADELPEGFVLENDRDNSDIPEGFVLDEPKPTNNNMLDNIHGASGVVAHEALRGMLSLPDLPASLLFALPKASASALADTVRMFGGNEPKSDASFLERWGQEVEDEPLAPQLGRFVDVLETPATAAAKEKYPVLAASAQGAGAGAPFGPAGAIAGGVSGGVTEQATQMGLPEGASALVGMLAGSKVSPRLGVKKLSGDIPASTEIAENASKLYKQADNLGGSISSKTVTDKFVNQVGRLEPQTKAGKLIRGGDTEFAKVAGRVKQLKNKPLKLQEAQEIDEFLSQKIDDFYENGRIKKEGLKFMRAQDSLREMMDEAAVSGKGPGFEALKTARMEWSKSARLRDIERMLEHAETAQNPATAIRNGARTLIRNKKRFNSYSSSEQQLLREAASGGLASDALKNLGSRLVNVVALGSGGSPGQVAATMGGSALARGGADAIQMQKALDLQRLVATGQKPPRANRAAGVASAQSARKKGQKDQ